MDNWYSIIFGIIILGIIIVFHEFGHFIVAKKCGVNVTEFMVGLGPVLFEKIHNDTRYTLRCIPFGGACIMQGDDKGIPDTYDEESEANLPEEGSFQSKNVWQRIAIIFAGPFFNFILAFVFAVIVLGYVGVDIPKLNGVIDDLPAQKIGLQAEDVVKEISGVKIRTARDITVFMDEYKAGDELDIVITRDGETKEFHIVPEYSEEYEKYMLGIQWSLKRVRVGALETIGYSFYEVAYWIKLTIKSIGMLFTGGASVDDLSGPVGIVEIVDETVEASKESGMIYIVLNLMNLCILLSANIGIMNLIPIPALDGGRLVFLLIEAVRGKPIDKSKEGYVHLAGMLFMVLLMIVVMFNDFKKLFM